MPISRFSPALRYSRHGSGDAVILIHGVGSQADDWGMAAAEMGTGFDILRYDLRGHGGSDAPPGPYAITDFSDDLIALMDQLQITRAHIAGFSLGGLIAQSMALHHPDRVDRLALIGTVAGRTEEERARVTGRLDFIASTHPSAYFDQSVERWFTPDFIAAHPEIIRARKKVVTAMDQNAYAAAYHALAHTDFGEDLHGIRAETLVMTGEDDVGSNPRMARFMHDMIPRCQLRILPGLRHSILLQAPETVGRLLRAFFIGEPLPEVTE